MAQRRRLVVVGAGFGGLNLIKYIDKRKWEVTVIDRNNYHSFPPLFYQVAASGLEPASISFPLRREMRKGNMHGARFTMDDVSLIDVKRREVHTQYETIPYDALVIAAGTTNNYFGIKDLEKRVFTLKSVSEAIRTRNVLLERLERAAQTTDPEMRKSLLAFTVVGGGPTGVEIAGALGEVKRYVVKREYPEIDPSEVKVRLIEGSDRLLRTMSERSSADAAKALGELMVDVVLGKTMIGYDGHVVTFADGETIATDTVIWTAGITAEHFEFKGAEVQFGPGGRFVVDEYNRVLGIDDVYAIGDICIHTDESWPHGMPQLAQPAIQQGRTLAHNLNDGSMKRAFSYRDKGSMATIGRNRAVVDMGKMHLSGWIAWIAWMVVHLMSLLGMRNKTVVLLNWMWGYFNYYSSLRLLLRPSRYPLSSYVRIDHDAAH